MVGTTYKKDFHEILFTHSKMCPLELNNFFQID